jgi:hypothetical protein
MIRPARPLVVLAMLMAVGLTLSTAAWAHPRPVPPSIDDEATPAPVSVPVPVREPAAAPSAPTPLIPGLVVGVTIAAVLATRRRGLIGVLALALIALAAETGVHSVHHLADRQAAAECVVALATAQVHGTVEPAPHVHDLRLDVPLGSITVASPERPGARPSRPDEGRAPPAA